MAGTGRYYKLRSALEQRALRQKSPVCEGERASATTPTHKFDELFIKAGYVVALRFSFRTRHGQ